MLHYLRQIRQKLIIQENVRKYFLYGLGEILLVVIGILIALQVNNWNEQRIENNKGQEYLVRLLENLEEDYSLIKERVEFLNVVEDYAEFALTHAEGTISEEVDDWEILLAYFQSSQIWPLVLTDVTYDELKSSGEIELLRSFKLRKDLSVYYGEQYQQYINTVGTLPVYRAKIRGLITYKVQKHIWENCHETSGTSQILVDCEGPGEMSSDEISVINEKIKQNELVKDLRFWTSNLNVGIDIIQSQGSQAADLIQLIKEVKEN